MAAKLGAFGLTALSLGYISGINPGICDLVRALALYLLWRVFGYYAKN